MYIILVYDIALDQNGAKVLRHVFKICKKYLSHVQKSVFEGELTKSQLQKLTTELDKWVDLSQVFRHDYVEFLTD